MKKDSVFWLLCQFEVVQAGKHAPLFREDPSIGVLSKERSVLQFLLVRQFARREFSNSSMVN
jgi:hypothetical protein